MSEQRIVWLGESKIPPFRSPNNAWVNGLMLRQQEIEMCDIAILHYAEDPSAEALSELAFAIAKGRQTLYCPENEGYEINNACSWLMRSCSHYVRYLTREQASFIAPILAQHSCGRRISVAFPNPLLGILGKAQSPIETRLGIHLAVALDLFCDLEPQVELDLNGARYRADFLVSDKDYGIKLVVECDGHDFHERTREQATRDKRRDRAMLANGVHVMRFTGSEIWKDPVACANEVREFVSNHAPTEGD